jgi:hypothetical protein
MAAMHVEGIGRARLCEAFGANAGAGKWKPLVRTSRGTPSGRGDHRFVSARAGGKLWVEHREIAFTSSRASICGRRDRPIRKKIIGHGMSVFPCRFTGGSVFLNLLGVLPLLHQPASQHGRGIFLHPKIEQSADLLAEIGGMAETREFVALERVSRSREEELPRRLGLVVVHMGLLGSDGCKLTVY